MILTTNDVESKSGDIEIRSLRIKAMDSTRVNRLLHTCCNPHVVGSIGLGIINVALCSAHSVSDLCKPYTLLVVHFCSVEVFMGRQTGVIVVGHVLLVSHQ